MEQTTTPDGSDDKSNLCNSGHTDEPVIQPDNIMHTDKIMQVLNSSSMGIWRIIMSEGKEPRLSTSLSMLKLLGIAQDSDITPEDMYKSWGARVCRDELPRVHQYIQDMMDGKNVEITYKWNHPTLGIRYIRCGGTGYKDENDNQILEGYHYDVTDIESQRQQNLQVVKSFANTYAAIYYIDVKNDTYTSYINNLPQFAKNLPHSGCFSESKLVYPNLLCNAEDRENLLAFIDFTTINERMRNRNSISMQYRGVSFEYAELTLTVCDRDREGSIQHIVATVKDITAEKREEIERIAELRKNIEANKAKTVMLQNMTHEIRTPLNALYGFSQLLCMPDGSYTEKEKNEFFDYIYNSFNMLSMIIDDVMDLTDVEHGNYRVQMSQFAVNRVCRDAIQMAELRKQGPVRMYFTSEVEDNYTIESDNRRIQQVLVNLLTNACKHTIQGEIHLHLSTSETPGRLTFSVTDTGEGIPVGQAKDIFQRYKKANNLVQGSGLGLHICCTIAKKLGAEIKLDENYKEGARFLMIL